MLRNIVRAFICTEKVSTQIFSSVRHASAYEGDGKTTVRVLNQEQDLGIMIDSYATFGFRLNNGITVLGPIAIFPRTMLSWQVTSSDLITKESLRLFKLLEPQLDLVILGLETSDRKINGDVLKAARAIKLNVEILPIEHACSTYNFLLAEGRCIAGAFIPPRHITLHEDDMLRSKMHYQNLWRNDTNLT